MPVPEFIFCEKLTAVKTLWWCLIVIGILTYAWSLAAGIAFSTNYPFYTRIVKSIWLWHASSFLFLFWMPLSYLLIYFRKKPILFPIAFILGCLLSIVLMLVSAAVSLPYLEDGYVKNEYLKELKNHLENQNTIPVWAQYSGCCGWDGSQDFEPILERGQDFLMAFTNYCFRSTSHVNATKRESVLDHFHTSRNITEPLKGCGHMLQLWVDEHKEVIFAFVAIITPFGVTTIGVYFYYYDRLLRHKRDRDGVSQVSCDVVEKHVIIPNPTADAEINATSPATEPKSTHFELELTATMGHTDARGVETETQLPISQKTIVPATAIETTITNLRLNSSLDSTTISNATTSGPSTSSAPTVM